MTVNLGEQWDLIKKKYDTHHGEQWLSDGKAQYNWEAFKNSKYLNVTYEY